MAKLLKKVVMVLCAFTMMFLFWAPMSTRAEEERVIIYVNPPEDWNEPFLWAWDEAGNNAFASWPGGEMEVDPDNEGWYYIWVPSWANHMIVSAGEEIQTGELISEGGNVWVTIEGMENAEISYDALTEGELPAYVEKFKIHVSLPDDWQTPVFTLSGAADEDVAGENASSEMLKMSDDGWYTGRVPVDTEFIILSGSEDDQKTEAISTDPAEVWITVTEDGSFDFSYNDPNAVEAPDISVSVKVPEDWESPCLWAWSAPDGTNVFASWPGEVFLKGEDGWLTLQVPGWVNSVIVNGNEGSIQTNDISVDTAKDVWIVVSGPEEYEVSYEVISTEEMGENAEEMTAQKETASSGEETAAEEPAQTAEEAKSGSNTGMIVVIVVICIIIVVLAVFFVAKKKK
ncbi:MAG: starch-binding protein [Lachnospiraceae bacterium]|nr:starch-binding protein [Lachnospiraceae bacterium]